MKYTAKRVASLLDSIMDAYQGVSRQKAKSLLKYYSITRNGEKVHHPATEIAPGDVLEFVKNDRDKSSVKNPTRQNPVVIYFEDAHVLVAVKPAGVLTHADKQDRSLNYKEMLEVFVSERDKRKTRLWVVHRLDREVEGLLVFAKSEAVQQDLKNNWADVEKRYLALTEQKPPEKEGEITSWLKDGPKQKVISYPNEVPDSKFARTSYVYLRQEKRYHLLEVTLHTGRKNQIRVHLSQIGCPIVGDWKYGAAKEPVRQIRLASCLLAFTHPRTGQRLEFHYEPAPRFFTPSEKADEKYK